ncbi:hypothetical protein [Cupriavidus consociatus]|uniref:hypothetical protein n=1 Tax=Cupriavidus consociatus TaxID=2821357 RepID=UPI001AE37CA4|nr:MULTISPECIES: hypothetical protein [unclassified Cupriavidus]MBP0623932.1 hypothetical protein [Cupriavidus sp. LEh25]MDK2660640.1 hypothetical protein [Cupriavidus sp. LEh21]
MSKRFLLVLAISFFLAGCGGGGDDNDSNEAASTPVQPLTVPLSTAMAGLAANGLTANFSISGTVENVPVSGSGTLTATPFVATFLNNTSVLRTTETLSGTLVANGNSVPFSNTRTVFRNTVTYAVMVIDEGDAFVVFADHTIPPTVKAGDSGPLASATIYSDSTRATKVGTLSESYSVATDTGNSLLLTLLDTVFDNGNARIAEDETTFRIDTSGNISFVSSKSMVFDSNGQSLGTLVFQ